MKHSALAVLALAVLTGFTSPAQMGGAPQTGFNAALTKLFGSTTAFSARCEVRMLDANQKEKLSMPMEFAMSDGKVRAEVDLTKLKGQGMNAEQAAQLKQMGMERIISVTRPDKKAMYLVYPAMQACVNMPLPKDDVVIMEQEAKLEKTVLGKEKVDNHPCEKAKVIVTDASGKKTDALVWTASDLKDFPVQIQSTENGQTVIFRYTDVQLAKPDAKLFDVPSDYKTYDSMQAFTMGMMQKMMGGMDRK